VHERKVMDDLVAELGRVAAREGPIERVRVRLGALSHFTPEHFREHFEDATRGTPLAGVDVESRLSDDVDDPAATGVVLESVDVAG
jgi:hydrogenase nickel incorporation protein HypA/HybF